MDIDAYCDSIIDLLVEKAGVSREEIERSGYRDLLAMAHMKGRDWMDACRSACGRLGVEIAG